MKQIRLVPNNFRGLKMLIGIPDVPEGDSSHATPASVSELHANPLTKEILSGSESPSTQVETQVVFTTESVYRGESPSQKPFDPRDTPNVEIPVEKKKKKKKKSTSNGKGYDSSDSDKSDFSF